MWWAPKNVYKHDNDTLNDPRKTNKNLTKWKLKSSILKIRKKRPNSSWNDDKKPVSSDWSRLYLHFWADEANIENGGTSLNKTMPSIFWEKFLNLCTGNLGMELSWAESIRFNASAEHEEHVRWRCLLCSAILQPGIRLVKKVINRRNRRWSPTRFA